MEIRKLLIAAAASAAVMLVLAILWHIIIMDPFYAGELSFLQEVVSYDVIALAYLVLGALMAIVYPKGYTGGPPAAEGFRFGLVMGLICALPAGMVVAALTGTVSGAVVLVEAAWHMVEQGIGGMVVGMVFGYRGERPPDEDELIEDALR